MYARSSNEGENVKIEKMYPPDPPTFNFSSSSARNADEWRLTSKNHVKTRLFLRHRILYTLLCTRVFVNITFQ